MTTVAWIVAAIAFALAGALLVALRRARARRAPAGGRDEGAGRPHPEELRRRAVLASLPMPAIVVDARARISETNPAARSRFPFLRPGMPLLDAFGEHVLAGRVRTAVDDLTPAEFTARLYLEGRRTFRVLVAPYEVEGAREALMVLTDASDAVAYQALRSQFVANVSHELKTPLTGLRGLLEALEDPDMEEATRSRFVARCRDEAERLEALISDILFLSELEATQGMPSEERSDLAAAAMAEVEAQSDAAAARGVRLEAEVPDEPVPTPLTERMARTVARNLVENAARYAGAGAVARVRVERLGDEAVLTVADDGVGIPERHLAHVFERFYRVDASRSRRLGGTGLGLSIVKHIAERFGGGARVTSREGFGTTVTVVLPQAAEGDPGAPVEAPLEPGRATR